MRSKWNKRLMYVNRIENIPPVALEPELITTLENVVFNLIFLSSSESPAISIPVSESLTAGRTFPMEASPEIMENPLRHSSAFLLKEK